MEPMNVEDTLRKIVRKNSRLEVDRISGEDTLAGDLGFDSLAFLMLLSDLEATFRVSIPVEKVEDLRDLSFQELVRLVTAKSGQADHAVTAVLRSG
jgi:acyl carrier protein